jgi:hypothetical protein
VFEENVFFYLSLDSLLFWIYSCSRYINFFQGLNVNKIFLPIFILLSLFSFNVLAEGCFKISSKDIKIKWTAFKTPSKIGVSGHLDTIWPKGPKQAASIEELIKATSLTIGADGKSVNTKNKARDIKIAKHFFNGRKITAIVESYTAKKLVLNVTMLGKTRKVRMSSKLKGNKLKAKGHLDVLDFSMSKQLKALNKACFAKHEGKTWSDVSIELTADFTGC